MEKAYCICGAARDLDTANQPCASCGAVNWTATPLWQPPAPLSFRDQCAIALMSAWLSTYGDDVPHPATLNPDDKPRVLSMQASMAFDLADAMQAERTKRGNRHE
jgi:hypothetical protein